MYRIMAYQSMGHWCVAFSRTPTNEGSEASLAPWGELAVVPTKEGRDPDLDAMQAIAEGLDLWMRVAAERAC
jgi:hypothetical protein